MMDEQEKPSIETGRKTGGETGGETVERVVSGLAGAAFEGLENVNNGISALWNFNKSVLHTAGEITAPLRRPLDVLGVSEFVRQPVEAVVTNVEERVAQLEEKGRAGLAQTSSFTIQTISGTIDAIIEYLRTNPQVDKLIHDKIDQVLPLLANNVEVQKLVRKQVDAILPTLAGDPTIQQLIQTQATLYLATLQGTLDANLQGLIRQQGDAYIDYLNANPQSVKNLVQGQSMSLAGEVMDEVRERTVTADSVAEMIVRRILGRKQREQLEPPPPYVQRRAQTARLPSDFVNTPLPSSANGNPVNRDSGHA